MALLDRFRPQSRDKHPDPAVRLQYVEELPLDQRDELAAIAREDEDPRVRRAAVGKLMDPAVLATLAEGDSDEDVRVRASDMLRDIALDAFEGLTEADALAAVDRLREQKVIAQVAKSSANETVARRALGRVTDAKALGSIARHATLEPVRGAALAALREEDREELVAVAMNSDFKDSALAALDRLDEADVLEAVAARARNKASAKRARAILREREERAAAEAAARAAEEAAALAAERTAARAAEQAAAEATAPEPLMTAEAAAPVAEMSVAPDMQEEAAAASEAEQAALEQEATERRVADEKENERRRARQVELAAEAEAAAGDTDVASARRRFALLRREWKDLTAAGEVDAAAATQVAAAETRLAARESEVHDLEARTRREGLGRMHNLLGRVEPLVAKTDASLKALERALRDVRTALADIPPLPSRQDFEDVSQRLKAVQSALMPRVAEARETLEWQQFANVSVQERLIARMEALKAIEDPEHVAREIRQLQTEWRQSADVPRTQADALWRRFKAAHDELWARCESHFAVQAQERAANLARKTALCEQAEALAGSTDWIRTADAIKALQAEWKTIGPVSRGQEKAIWERFRSACDRFFTRRHEDLALRKAVWSENLARKEALITRAEELAQSTDWEAAAAEIKKLQADWKTIGPVKKSRSEAIWQRFRGACDTFFSRYTQRHEIARGERVAAREAIVAELEALVAAEGDQPADLLQSVRSIRGRWQQELALRGVDRDRAVALDQRFVHAFEGLAARWPDALANTDLDPEANRRRMEALVKKAEDLAGSLGSGPKAAADEAVSPTTRLAAMLKEALAANTIGGKVDDSTRFRAAQDELRQLQAAWTRLGPVPDAARRALGDRFQRACGRVSAATSRPGDRQPRAGARSGR